MPESQLAKSPLPTPSRPYPIPTNLRDFMKVEVPDGQSWECNKRPGDLCQVPFAGSVFLETADQGQILLIAYENGSKKPAATRTLTPAKKGRNLLCPDVVMSCYGTAYGFGAMLNYVVGPTAKRVSFAVELKNLHGKLLAAEGAGSWIMAPSKSK